MPVGLDPTETYRYVISTDRTKPEGEQPALIFHYPTCRETRKIANLLDESERATTLDEGITKRCEAIRVILVGWEHFNDRKGNAILYNPDELDDVLSDADFTELNARLLTEMSASELEKKRYALFPQSSSESSAVSAMASV
jgi:hypothetical protein